MGGPHSSNRPVSAGPSGDPDVEAVAAGLSGGVGRHGLEETSVCGRMAVGSTFGGQNTPPTRRISYYELEVALNRN